MNTKRQTVWLVSMLGLMVVLSAYYLFTDEVKPEPADQTVSQNEIELDGVRTADPSAGDDSIVVDGEDVYLEDIASEETGAADPQADAPETSTADKGAAIAGDELTDEEILRQLAAEKDGSEAIAAMQMERTEKFADEIEKLTATITDSEASNEAVNKATQRQNELFDLDARLVAFEEKLMVSNYSNAVVTYDEATNHYTVNVNSPSLEKSEAVSIIKMAIEDLGISMHQISVKLYR
ncbi:SpoIIIAH-like family protein [Paenibacillus thermotolerans]|uniref:SpoIIIAH-like family protein n=1 Tax=Paenibacillus thermotolerans TaxID=3027807 RepID=UPI002368D827|nr:MULTISPECIES: SpoIIIAH-like family protein [unclassified Paenibacillus]